MKRVVVTGAGVIAPLGNDPADFFRALTLGESGVRKLHEPWAASLASPYAAIVDCDLESRFPKLKRIGLDRVAMLALLAARNAVTASGIEFSGERGETSGTYWGTGMGGATALESAYREIFVANGARLKPSTIVLVMNNAATGQRRPIRLVRGLRPVRRSRRQETN